MRRLPIALLASFTVLASAPTARGSQKAVAGADETAQQAAELQAGSSHPRQAAPETLGERFVPARAPQTDPEAVRWRASVARRLAALDGTALPETTASATDPALSAQLRRLTEQASRTADVGVAVRTLDTGAPVFSFQAEKGLNPASNHKLLTAIAAVELLGADYRFTTEVRVAGDALVLVGDGDPSLQVEDLSALARRTIDAGIDLSKIRRIVADDSAFSSRRFGPGYSGDGPGWSYLAPSGALSLQFNTVTVAVHAGASGQAPSVTVQPPCPYIVVQNHARAGRRTHVSVQTYARGATTVVDVHGTVGPHGAVSERRRVVDPARFAASSFALALASATSGTPLPVAMGVAPDDAPTVARHDSAPLPEVLSAALVFSNNFTSEQVLRTLGRRLSGAPGDWANGHVALERFWSAIGRSPQELTFENASGYSQTGRLTADAIVALLSLTQRPGAPSQALQDILPAAGKHGTMRHRLTRAKGRVRAKTGTLSGASALSGMVVSRDGARTLGFSILVNGTMSQQSSHRLQDRVVMALVEHLN